MWKTKPRFLIQKSIFAEYTIFTPNTEAISLTPDTFLGAVGYQNNKKSTEDKEILKYHTQFHYIKLIYLVFLTYHTICQTEIGLTFITYAVVTPK